MHGGRARLRTPRRPQGLPSDPVSIENGIILSKSTRWPLCIDPQGQATAWIKNMQREMGLIVCKVSDKDYAKQLETAIRSGQPCLLENLHEELDPLLDPVLMRQTFTLGNAVMIRLGVCAGAGAAAAGGASRGGLGRATPVGGGGDGTPPGPPPPPPMDTTKTRSGPRRVRMSSG